MCGRFVVTALPLRSVVCPVEVAFSDVTTENGTVVVVPRPMPLGPTLTVSPLRSVVAPDTVVPSMTAKLDEVRTAVVVPSPFVKMAATDPDADVVAPFKDSVDGVGATVPSSEDVRVFTEVVGELAIFLRLS